MSSSAKLCFTRASVFFLFMRHVSATIEKQSISSIVKKMLYCIKLTRSDSARNFTIALLYPFCRCKSIALSQPYRFDRHQHRTLDFLASVSAVKWACIGDLVSKRT
jgi:hypothetical protein